MIPGKGGAQRGHDIPDVGVPEDKKIEITLHQDRVTAFPYLLPGLDKSVKVLPFAEERRLGGIEIFGHSLPHDAAAEGDDLAGLIFDGKDKAAPETVIEVPPLVFRQEARLLGKVKGHSLPFQIIP